jgi:hypothetical protein
VRLYYLASLWDLYDLLFTAHEAALKLHMAAAAIGAEPLSVPDISLPLRLALDAMAAVSPGSDLHVILAAKSHHMEVQEAHEVAGEAGGVVRGGCGNGDVRRLERAWRKVEEAHLSRYGPVSRELLGRLSEANRTMYDEQ